MKKKLLVSMLLCAAVSFAAQGMKRPADGDGEPAPKRARLEGVGGLGAGGSAERQDEDKVSSLAFFAMDSFYQQNLSDAEFNNQINFLPPKLKEKIKNFKTSMDAGKKAHGLVDLNQVFLAAIYAGDIDMVNYLMRHKKVSLETVYSDDSSILNKKELTPLHIAAGAEIKPGQKNDYWDGNAESVRAILVAAGEGAKSLVKAQDGLGRTPLFKAVGSGNVEVMQALLDAAGEEAKSLVTSKDAFGRTPLHEAACLANVEAVRSILAAAGEDARSLVQLQCNFEKTAQQEAQDGIFPVEGLNADQALLQEVKNKRYESIIALMATYFL